MQIKSELPDYRKLHSAVDAALTPERQPLLIGIDGVTGWGKTSTACWIAWQFGMPCVHLDFYTDDGTRMLTTFAAEVKRLIDRRVKLERRPLVVEGILLLEALEATNYKPDFLIFMEGKPQGSMTERIKTYRSRYQPHSIANFVMHGFDELADLRKAVLHHNRQSTTKSADGADGNF